MVFANALAKAIGTAILKAFLILILAYIILLIALFTILSFVTRNIKGKKKWIIRVIGSLVLASILLAMFIIIISM